MNFASTKMPLVPVESLIAATGLGKSRMFRAAAVKVLNRTKYEGCVVIAVDRHDLGVEQLDAFHREHPGTALVASIWRGRGADDPLRIKEPVPEHRLMCWRNEEAEDVSAHGFPVEESLCKQVDAGTGEGIYCRFYALCGYQRQKVPANIWFCAHESVAHEVPPVFGKVLALYVDEDPLDAFFYGIEKVYEVPLDALSQEPEIRDEEQRQLLAEGRRQLHEVLSKLPEGPVPLSSVLSFSEQRAYELFRIEWGGKVDVELRPDMTAETVRSQLALAAGNKIVIRLARLWRLIAEASAGAFSIGEGYSGRIALGRDKDGVRVIRMKGINEPAAGWRKPTMISSATLDPELLRSVWPPRRETFWDEEEGRYDFKELKSLLVARPPHVVVRQVVDNSFSKTWMLPTEPKDRIERAREIFAMVLREASKFAPLRSLLILHLGAEAVIEEHCCVPPWIELAHHGDIVGFDKWKTVRAAFVVGRAMPPAELITQQAEAIGGEYIAQRSYVEREAIIATVQRPEGNAVYVKSFEHPHKLGQRLLRRVVWGGVLQEVGRTRYIRRGANDPLDIWLVNDIAVPELGDVIPVQWVGTDPAFGPNVGPTVDDTMLTSGCWLENASDAKRVHDGLIASPGALRDARSRTGSAAPYQKLIAEGSIAEAFQVVGYRRNKPGAKTARAIFLAGLTHDPKAWLEERLGEVLAEFEVL